MSVLEEWQVARPLPAAATDLVRRLAEQPVAAVGVTLPVPPGINGWWEPVALRRRGRLVAALRLTKDATAYKHLAERTLLETGLDPVELEDGFHDLWLDLRVISRSWFRLKSGLVVVLVWEAQAGDDPPKAKHRTQPRLYHSCRAVALSRSAPRLAEGRLRTADV